MSSFQAFTRIASVIFLTGLAFSAFSILLKERLFKKERAFIKKKMVVTYIDSVVWRCKLYSSWDSEVAEMNVEYDLKVEVSSNASEQENTSDDDEPEDAYANAPLADENQYEAEGQKEQELDGLLLKRSVQGLKKRTVPCFYDVLPQLRLAGFERCVHKFPDFLPLEIKGNV